VLSDEPHVSARSQDFAFCPELKPPTRIRGQSGHARTVRHAFRLLDEGKEKETSDPSRADWALLCNIGSERDQVLNRLRRPDDFHVADRLGTGRSRLRSQEFTHAWTSLRDAFAAVKRSYGPLDAGKPAIHSRRDTR
jgi:hypothetical protein